MNADATMQGDGGVVINWADGTTVSSGVVSAKGGPLGGNGGFVEISGKQNLGFDGAVNLSAALGKLGTVLLDPDDLWIIGSGPDSQKDSVTSQYEHYLNNPSDFYWYNGIWVTTAPVITHPLGVILDAANIQADVIFSAANVYFTDRRTLTYEKTTVSWGFIRSESRDTITTTYDLNPAKIALQADASLTITATAQIWMPAGSSITASGSGKVSMDASSFSLQGTIVSESGNIILTAQNGINLTGAKLKSTNGGSISLISPTNYLQLYNSQIETTAGDITISSFLIGSIMLRFRPQLALSRLGLTIIRFTTHKFKAIQERSTFHRQYIHILRIQAALLSRPL